MVDKKQLTFGDSGALAPVAPIEGKYEKKPVPKKKRKFEPKDFKRFEWLNPVTSTTEVDAAAAAQQEQMVALGVKMPEASFIEFLNGRVAKAVDRTMTEARSLLLNMPIKGRHIKGFKEGLKDVGARWWKNPAFDEEAAEEYDPDCPPGWFVAPSISTLGALLGLPKTQKKKRAWIPLYDGEEIGEQMCQTVITLLKDYEAETKAQQTAAQKEAEAKRRQQAERASSVVVGADAQDHVDKLTASMKADGECDDWVYDKSEIMLSAIVPELGPMMSSNALRVWRALKLGLLTAAQVAAGDFVPEHSKQSKSRRTLATAAATEAKTAIVAEKTEKTEQKKQKKVEFLAHDDNRPEALARKAEEADALKARNAAPRSNESIVITHCDACGQEIIEQFLTCYCCNRAWKADGSWVEDACCLKVCM